MFSKIYLCDYFLQYIRCLLKIRWNIRLSVVNLIGKDTFWFKIKQEKRKLLHEEHEIKYTIIIVKYFKLNVQYLGFTPQGAPFGLRLNY